MVKEQLSLTQVTLLITITRLTVDYLYLPLISAPPANQDMWIVSLLAVPYIIVLAWPILYLCKQFPSLSFADWLQVIVGKIPGRIICLLHAGFILFVALLQLLYMVNFLRAIYMPETPEYATLLLMAITCIYGAYSGIECLARLNQIIAPFILGTIILFTILNYRLFELSTFSPILVDSSLSSLNHGALTSATRFAEVALLPLLATKLEKGLDIKRAFIYGLVLLTMFELIVTVSTIGVLGVETAKHTLFPYYLYTRQVSVFDFIERTESLSSLTWFLGVFTKFAVFLYFSATLISQVFSLKSYKTLLIPLSAALVLITLYTPLLRSVNAFQLRLVVYPYVAFIVLFVIPLLVLGVYLLRKKSPKRMFAKLLD